MTLQSLLSLFTTLHSYSVCKEIQSQACNMFICKAQAYLNNLL